MSTKFNTEEIYKLLWLVSGAKRDNVRPLFFREKLSKIIDSDTIEMTMLNDIEKKLFDELSELIVPTVENKSIMSELIVPTVENKSIMNEDLINEK